MSPSSNLNQPVRVSREIAGRTLTLETGRMAKQADGAVFASFGETSLIATAQGAEPRAELDFFPLTVEYREKTYAAGKVPGGFFKREMRPRDTEILVARSIDRPVRPMWPAGYNKEVQVIINVLSFDRENAPDTLAGIAAMTALTLSSLPFQGPGATVRVGYVDGKLVLFPTADQMATSELDLMVAGTHDAVTMVEGLAQELPDEFMADAILFAHDGIRELCTMIDELASKAGRQKVDVEPAPANPFAEKVERWRDALSGAMDASGKHAKRAATKAVVAEALAELLSGVPEDELSATTKVAKKAFHDLEGDIERQGIIQNGRRMDGRKLDEVRPIEIEVGVLARTHGSALFTRGETQALVTVTLGTGRDEQIVDGLQDEYSKRFMLHYNFPPFCVGEVRRMFSTSRREIGHGMLAERAVNMVTPPPEEFPYSMRVVSEILESNGSSSMASVCGATLALLDAGCPLASPVAGIAMGLIEDGKDHYILTDILGSEDHNGDMDFKVAGTAKGVTAVQMDIKIQGLSAEILKRALRQAYEGRLHILEKMKEAIAVARPEVSRYAPQLIIKQIDPEKIGALIGPGGKIIRAIQSDYKVRVEVNDEGVVTIAGGPGSDLEAAVAHVEAITGDAEVGATYKGKVVSIREFGAFIELFPGKEGLLHVSGLGKGVYVKSLDDYLKVGEPIEVRCSNIDEFGRVRLELGELDADHALAKIVAAGGDGSSPPKRGEGRRGDRHSERQEGPSKGAEDLKVGEIYTGTVHGSKNYGIFVELLPGVRGLCHISEMVPRPTRDPSEVVSMGDEVRVKVLEVEDSGRIRLSMRAAADGGDSVAVGDEGGGEHSSGES